MALDWGDPLPELASRTQWDYIIGSDVAYDEDCFTPLLQCICQLIASSPGANVRPRSTASHNIDGTCCKRIMGTPCYKHVAASSMLKTAKQQSVIFGLGVPCTGV